MPRVIAVTGATGALGRRVVQRLVGRADVGLRLAVRDAARAPRVADAAVAAVPGLVTDVVPTLTDHPARTVAEHLRAHPEDWAHLPPEQRQPEPWGP